MASVLIVLDGGYRFSATDGIPDFTYTAMVEALTGAGHSVTKAHRQSDTSGAVLQNFNFETSTNLLNFDVIWLIGFQGRNSLTSSGTSGAGIGATEIRAIARFMAAGGGVFATGDHDSIGSEMSGHIPRVRAMRAWYGVNDSASPMPAAFPRNFPVITAGRADTTQRNPTSDYGGDTTFVWFENQSDSVPQPITPMTSPAHPILRRDGNDIIIYPDHMHEGTTLGEVMGYDYTQSLPFAGESFTEFPDIAGHREMPQVIATGQTGPHASKSAETGAFVGSDSAASGLKTVNTLCVYDGRVAGVGRVVTGATFHHYVDINLTGDSAIDTAQELARTGPESAKGHGFAHPGAEARFADIKQVYVNITNWLARPRPAIQLILERSTFSQAEASANSNFDGAILIIVDGLKPSQFPGGGITSLSPGSFQPAWAPTITPVDPQGLSFVPTAVASDDPALPDRLQRFTFTYRVVVNPPAFGFGGNSKNIRIDASLTTSAAAAALTDSAWIQMTKSANPFMLDLANNNDTAWLSSDVRVFPVVAGTSKFGVSLPLNASRADALNFLSNLMSSMSVAEFESLSMDQEGSALSPFPTATLELPFIPFFDFTVPVYNFAVARVRIPVTGASADDVRVFFRIFTSQTTAALTYNESPPGTPIEGYKRTAAANPIALPGTNGAGNEWLSFPMFSVSRVSPPENQTDPDNLKDGLAPGSDTFFGALIDNNLQDNYLPSVPGGGGSVSLPTLMMGEHQCLVAQIEFAGTPIPSGANPLTSDKLAQRNIALSAIANPGLDASRMALHTFELEATPMPIPAARAPDELLLDWHGEPPEGTEVQLYLPGWNAHKVVELADLNYARHEIRAIDDHTIGIPGGGVRYVPLPPSAQRQTGVISAHLPLGVTKGQRFDLSVRQITTRGRFVDTKPPKVTKISKAEAARLLQAAGIARPAARRGASNGDVLPRGVFDLGKNKVLITDLRVLDAVGDHALVVEHPDRKAIEAARRESAAWRQTVGAFQLGIPVSVKADMLAHHLRLLSIFRWRAEKLRPRNRWYLSFRRYVELIAEKVRALGGDPWTVPATPDGQIDLPGQGGGQPGGGGGGTGGAGGDTTNHFFEPGADDWLGDSDGLGAPDKAKAGMWSGKVSGLLFDHFGDFEGFTLESYAGSHLRFFSREAAILGIAKAAWIERHVVTVITVSAQSRRVRRILVRGYSD